MNGKNYRGDPYVNWYSFFKNRDRTFSFVLRCHVNHNRWNDYCAPIKLIVPALEDINTLFEKISSIEHELKLAFDRRHPFYTKKEILQRLKLAQNELKTIIEELEQQRIVENKTRND